MTIEHLNGPASEPVDGPRRVGRRTLLYAAAAGAGAVALAGCAGGDDPEKSSGSDASQEGKGSHRDPLPKPKKFSEAPQLKKLVKEGKLPPVEERLPTNPYVVPHRWIKEGKYGGSISTLVRGADDGGNRNWFYGSSLLRFVNDGLDVVGGLVETWDNNADTSEWTFKFREGLKWSDGEPLTVDDVLFWWEDMVLNPDHEDIPPDECRSGTGKVAELVKDDDRTFRLVFDAPAPLTAERMATWINGSAGGGPKWIVPKHFAQQFHPKYNPEIGDDWAVPDGLFGTKVTLAKNPDCPTTMGWKVSSYKEGRQTIWERNPYYWVVTPGGDQLPYVDQITWNVNPEPKVGKVDVYQGKVDFLSGKDYDLGLADIADLDASAEEAGLERILWDSGSGSGSLLMFNLDYPEEKYREVFRDKRFRQAISHAVDRKRIQKAVYFKTGYPTTGTLSPKAMEYVVNDEGKKVFEQWRDAHVEFDLDKAARLLDEVGLEVGKDGLRTFPDGSEFRLVISFPADTLSEDRQKNTMVVESLAEIGVKAVQDPVAPDSFGEQWDTGRLAVRGNWEVGDGPNHLLYPQWLVPIENTRFVPLQGRWYALLGTDDAKRGIDENDPWKSKPPRVEPEPDSPIRKLQKLYDQTKTEPEEMKRTKLVWDMIQVHIEEGPFFIGTVANFPAVYVKKKTLRNVPTRENLAQGGMAYPHIHPTPGVYDPEAFFWQDPENH